MPVLIAYGLNSVATKDGNLLAFLCAKHRKWIPWFLFVNIHLTRRKTDDLEAMRLDGCKTLFTKNRRKLRVSCETHRCEMMISPLIIPFVLFCHCVIFVWPEFHFFSPKESSDDASCCCRCKYYVYDVAKLNKLADLFNNFPLFLFWICCCAVSFF